MCLDNFIISVEESVIEALKKLNLLPNTQTIFVINSKNQLVGTLTDGDVRRGLIKGLTMGSSLEAFMFKEFTYLADGENNFKKLKELRERRLKAVPLLNQSKEIIKIYDFSYMKSILPVDAVIMAGGIGKRLRPLTNDTPKPLIKIGGKEIIGYNLERLHKFGIENQHISLNYLGEQIEQYCNDFNRDIHFNFIYEREFLGTAGALGLVKELKNDFILLMNSDLLTDIDYEDLFRSFIEKDADLIVASIPYTVTIPYALFETDEQNIIGLKEKPSYTYFANSGIYLFKKELLALVPHQQVFNATDLIEEAILNRMKVVHYPIRSYWLDIGNYQDYERAQKDVAHIDFS